MPAYNIVHFQNPDPAQENQFADWQRRELAPAALALPGVHALRHYHLQPVQLQPGNAQPFRLATLYELQTDDLASILPAISQLARITPKAKGLLHTDAAHVFTLTRAFLPSPNAPDRAAPFHAAFVMGNCIIGKEMEYDAWYDNVHSVEVLGTPGFIGMRRGEICADQLDAAEAQPANRLVMLMLRTRDLYASIEEFIDRAFGRSKSGIAWAPRENAAGFASLQRTTHVFSPYSPRLSHAAEDLNNPELAAQT